MGHVLILGGTSEIGGEVAARLANHNTVTLAARRVDALDGIGLSLHEEPFIMEGNDLVLEPGMAFSVEPGLYFEGDFGMRLEDIVVVTDDGCEPLNRRPHELVAATGTDSDSARAAGPAASVSYTHLTLPTIYSV